MTKYVNIKNEKSNLRHKQRNWLSANLVKLCDLSKIDVEGCNIFNVQMKCTEFLHVPISINLLLIPSVTDKGDIESYSLYVDTSYWARHGIQRYLYHFLSQEKNESKKNKQDESQ